MSDTAIYRTQGFGQDLGLGASPSLVIVDFVAGFADPEMFGGGNIADAIEATVALLAFARELRWPIAMTRIVFAEDGSNGNIFTAKVPGLLALTEANPASRIVAQLAPLPGELVVDKRLPSAFFDTGLAAWLTQNNVDTTVIAGCTTSGCIRASVLDAMNFGFRPMVISDCVGDRAQAPHDANLFDMKEKYADVMTSHELYRALLRRDGRAAV